MSVNIRLLFDLKNVFRNHIFNKYVSTGIGIKQLLIVDMPKNQSKPYHFFPSLTFSFSLNFGGGVKLKTFCTTLEVVSWRKEFKNDILILKLSDIKTQYPDYKWEKVIRISDRNKLYFYLV